MAATWVCGRCEVRISFAAGSAAPQQPPGWAREDGTWRCLGCRRLEVVEAIEPSGSDTRASGRRRALTEFELLRDPTASDNVIAKRVRCPTSAIPPVRAALRDAGRLAAEG